MDTFAGGADAAGFSSTTGVTIEAYSTTNCDGSDQAELVPKEDGGNRFLFSFKAGPD